MSIDIDKEREEFIKHQNKGNVYPAFDGDAFDSEWIQAVWEGYKARAKKAEEDVNKAYIDGYNRSVDEIFALKKSVEFAEYVCQRVDQMVNHETCELADLDEDDWIDYYGSSGRIEAIQALISSVYEFRKRK